MAKISAYIKNVAKSFGYAIGDELSSYSPVIFSLAKETKETATELYDGISSFTYSVSSPDENSIRSTIKSTVQDLWKNTKDDLKTGNWYNKERQEQLSNAGGAALGFDMNMDDWDLDFDWDDEDSSGADSIAASVSADAKMASEMMDTMDEVGFKVSEAINQGTVASANYIVKSNNIASRALYNLNSRGFATVSSALLNLNTSITQFAKIGEPLTAHIQNSATFYTNTSQVLKNIDQNIAQIVKNTTPAALAKDGQIRSIKHTFSDMFSSETGFSIESYKDMVKDIFEENKDMIDMALGLVKSFKDKDGSGSYGKYISPVQMSMGLITKVMIPKVFKESLRELNDSIKYSMGAGILRLRESESSAGMLWELAKEYLLPKDGFKKNINSSNYNKDRVAWDGISRKALIEVIPTTLLKIYSAITGGPEMRFDYDRGKFVTFKSISQQVEKTRRGYAQSAGGEFRTDIIKKIDDSRSLSPRQKEEYKKQVEEYFYQSFMKGGTKFADVFKSDFKYKDYGLTPESLRYIQEIIEENRHSSNVEKRRSHSKFITDVQDQRDSYGNRLRLEEANGDSIQIHLSNDSMFSQDNKSYKSMSSFIEGIYKNTLYLANNIGYISGRTSEVHTKLDDIMAPPKTDQKQSAGDKKKEDINKDKIPDDIKDEDEIRDEHRENLNNEAKKKAKGIWGSAMDFFFGKDNPKGLRAAYRKPFEAASTVLTNIGLSLDKLIWGDDKTPENGLFGFIFNKGKEYFEFLMKKLDIENKIKEWRVKLFGDESTDGFFTETKNKLKGVGSSIGNTVKQFFSPGTSNGSAAHGRKVTKSGIVAVSEGELIIPSELNPFYHGRTNKRQQIENEENILDNFFGSFAKGGTVYSDKKKKNRKQKRLNRKVQNQETYQDETEEENESFTSFMKRMMHSFFDKHSGERENEGAGHKFIRQGFETLGEGFSNVFGSVFGSGDKDQDKKDKEVVGNVAKTLLKEAGENSGAMGAGALIGAGASLLTGGVIGPVLGASVGAAVGLAANSKKVQHVLFGADPETGEVNGGLLSKNVSEFMMKKVPSIGKGAAIGTVGGLFMGSPIIGALVGGTVGYINKSESAKKWLFGDDQQDGVIPQELQKRIKAATPNISAGALLGLATLSGPFGIAGSLAIGAGLGYLSTSEEFKESMFGSKDKEGLLPTIRDKILGNLNEIFHNIGNGLKGWSKNLIRETTSRVKDFFTQRAKAWRDEVGGSRLGRAAGKVIGVATGATKFIGNRLEGISTRTKQRNLARGYDVWDRELGRNLYASERYAQRSEGAFGIFDSKLKDVKSKEDLDAMRNEIMDARDPSRARKRGINSAMSGLYGALKDVDYKTANKIGKLVEKGGTEYLDRISRSYPDIWATHSDAITKAAQAVDSANSQSVDSQAILKKYGLTNRSEANKALDYINYEAKDKRFSPEQEAENKEETWRERVVNIFKSIDANVAAIVPGGKGTTAEGEKNPAAEKVKEAVKEVEKQTKIATENNTEPRIEVTTDALGNAHTKKIHPDGSVEEIKNDSGNDEAQKEINEYKENIKTMAKSSHGLLGLLAGFESKLFGKDEEGKDKKGLFGKLLDSLSGEDSAIGGIFKFITNSATVASAFRPRLGTVMATAVAGSLVGAFLGNPQIKSFFEKIGNLSILKGNDTKSTFSENAVFMDDKQLAKDADGNLIQNENGEYKTIDGDYVSGGKIQEYGTDNNISKAVRRNTARQTVKNLVKAGKAGKSTISIAEAAGGIIPKSFKMAKNSLNKYFKKVDFRLNKTEVGKNFKKSVLDKSKTGSLQSGLLGMLTDSLSKIATKMETWPIIGKIMKGKAGTFVKGIFDKCSVAIKSLDVSKAMRLSKKFTDLLGVFEVVYIGGRIIDAWGNAESILGITDTATFGQRTVACLVAGLNAAVPIIGDLFSDKQVVNMVIEVAGMVGIEFKGLEEQRNKAAQEVAEYNAANNTDLNIEEYNQKVKNRGGIISKSWNKIKSWTNTNRQSTQSRTTASNYTTGTLGSGYNLSYNNAYGANPYTGSNPLAGMGSGFVSQLDPKYKSMKFGNSTVGEKGCAPAVASMMASMYGKNLPMNEAVNTALGYQNKDGTTIDYFNRVLNSKGIGTNFISGKDIPGQIMQNLANGQKVILLGKDARNTSKENSPFGPNGHYVIASGVDKNGNIIVYDPESNSPKTYNKSILNSIKTGLTTNLGGSGSNSYDTEVARSVYSFFTQNGFSPAATAGIMGNIFQESSMNPTAIQGGGKGPAAGLFQWENYNTKSGRWGNLQKLASSLGKDWTDLDAQLQYALSEINGNDINARFKNLQGNGKPFRSKNITENGITYNTTEGLPGGTSDFKNLTDPQKAMILFEAAFERAGKPNFARRTQATKAYYELYSGKQMPAYDPSVASASAAQTMSSGLTAQSTGSDATTTETPQGSSKGGILAALATISSAFSNAFNGIFANKSEQQAAANNVTPVDYSSEGQSNVVLGDVPQGKGNAAQKKIVQFAQSILGKNQYTQDPNLRTKVGSGYSDCSAFAQWAYKQALGIDPGSNTGSQIQSPLLTTVDAGTVPNKDNLEAGDLLFFKAKGNNGRYKNVGHVEIYDGNGNVIGHGSGQGPKSRNLENYVEWRNNYGGPYIEAKRYTDIAQASGGSSGLLLKSKPGSKLYKPLQQSSIRKSSSNTRYAGAGSQRQQVEMMLDTVRQDVTSKANAGTISADLVSKLLSSIIAVLETISKNTVPVDKIYQLLSEYLGKGGATTLNTPNQTSSTSSSFDIPKEVDANIKYLANNLAAIAKG